MENLNEKPVSVHVDGDSDGERHDETQLEDEDGVDEPEGAVQPAMTPEQTETL